MIELQRENRVRVCDLDDTSISRETISKITDRILEDMNTWQSRPLDRLHPVLLIDAIVVKVRDCQVAQPARLRRDRREPRR